MSGRLIGTGRQLAFGLADQLVTMPLLRWTWRGQGDIAFAGDLPDFRPSDREAVRDMMSGRYLLASKLFETGGASPFSLDVDHPDWWNNLHAFSWLRHFRDVRDPGEKLFARTLVLDWIGREGQFEHDSWTLTLTAQRVLNWLRHLSLLLDGATPDQARTIQRSLGTQVQSLRVRGSLAADPVETLFAAIGLLGAELCNVADVPDIDPAVARLDAALARQLDHDGLHLSRNPKLQLSLLTELTSLKRALGRHGSPVMAELANRIDRMHEALDALTLSSGEPAYFNNGGQVPHDILVAVQANGPNPSRHSQLLGGYGIVRAGNSVIVADSGLLPPHGFDHDAHAGALAFEFSHGSELILGSCGPAPSDMPESRDLFRQGIAHSAPTIDAEDAVARGRKTPPMILDNAEHMLAMTSAGYANAFGAEIERRLTLLSEGTTLVGQDRIVSASDTPSGRLAIRFHLGPGIMVRRSGSEGMARLVLSNGMVWSFLWEGAEFHEEDSVRQSSYVGFHRTRQLVLETDVLPGAEVAWIFTLEQ
ncbi:heparinase II/III family protein [Devosia sp. YIM 151766]|uniref:heparinase II/III family protein n=1 Tax=Devosia sp. YIM 151766 TaxID=3017325 RepID=UPI00255CBD95|nr:heparinase II/III family protein [Devosia sp. YIM 151766]WIY52808.1 heparinase II/III family protein [Devosia sp. YIM 151766]